MSKRQKHLDDILSDFPYLFGEVSARPVKGSDGRKLLQLRIDMGLLQMETTGRPDGHCPEGFETYYDYLVALAFDEGEKFELDEERCMEIDREFVQFFHRRISWLALREFENAVLDADHTLALMDFSSAHAPNKDWALMHEQYRPFVLFHRAQAAALTQLQAERPEQAVAVLDKNLNDMRQAFEAHDAEEEFEEDELVCRLFDMKNSITDEYSVEPSLTQQLAQAISEEHYELAAKLRDKIARYRRGSM